MDYCECEHCNSVLSPAAYLVDLLQSLEEWGKPDRLPAGSRNPYEALIAKRPDIPYISLTCENTHTALPYIDVVNEILEYYVAGDGKLTEDAAHDTGKATTAELLAEPQNIITDAYNKLHDAHYPLNLPFDLWIETVRQFCNYFDTPLHQLLETLRTSDQLFAPQYMYDRAAIFMESLALSPEETSILTRTDMLDKWADLYGFTNASAAILDTGIETGSSAKFARLAIANDEAAQFAVGDRCSYADSNTNALSNENKVIYSIGAPNSGDEGLVMIKLEGTWQQPPKPGDFLVVDNLITMTSAKQLARRLGITYQEITEIVLGGFVNPNLPSLGLLYKLGIGISDARLYKDHKDFYNQSRDLVDKERNDLQPADRQRFDVMSSQVAGTPFTGWHIVNELHALEQKLSVLKPPAVPLNELLAEIEHMPFDKVLVLADPDTGCDFDRTTLRYADGSDIKPVDLLRINLFVRLWRKLGWTIEEADRALSTFIPPEIRAGNDGAELAKWFKTALIYIAHLKTLADKLTLGKNSRIRLLTLWDEMATTGENPLYAQLFLTPGVLKNDPVFDHPLGDYLSASWIKQTVESRSYRAELPVVEKDKIDPTIFAGEPLEFSYDLLRGVQGLKVAGVFDDNRKSAWLQKLPDSPVLEKLLDDLQRQGKEFVLIKGHLPALQGALGLTAQEIEHILADNDRSIENAELSLENVSLLYRYGLLAKGVRLPVSELITLKQLSGCNPFIEPHNPLLDAPLESLDKDHLFSGTLAFVDLVEEIKSSGLSIEDIDYLLCHRFVEAGKYRSDSTATLALLRTIADGVRAIRTEHAVPEDAGMISEEVLRQKLGLVYENDVVDRLMKMMDGTIESSETDRDFFNDYFCRRTVRIEDDAGFLKKDEFDSFFASLKKIEGDQKEQDAIIEHNQQTILERHWQLARSFLPFLQRRLIRQFVVQTLQAHTQAEFNLIESLLTDERLLSREAQPLLRILESTGIPGLTVTFYKGANFVDAFGPAQVCPDADTGSKIIRNGKLEAIKPDTAKSARFEGYLLVPNSGSYRFLVELEAANAGSATPDVELHFLHLPQSRFLSTPAPDDGNTPSRQASEFLDLKAGMFYRFRLDIRSLQGGNVRLRVQSEILSVGSVSRLELYPSESMDAAEHALLSFTKALLLIQGFGLNEREIRYLLTHADHFDELNISALPIRNIQNPDGKLGDEVLEALHGCFTWFRRLVGYTRLKQELASGSDKLIDIFEVDEVTPADERGSTDRTFARIAALTRRDSITVRSAAYALFQSDPAFSDIAFFVDERRLQRLWQTLQVVERFGVPVGEIVSWSRIVNTTLLQEQRYEVAHSIKETIKARYEPEAWQRVARPIFDTLRQRQRDALVAAIMHQHRFARIEQLYEYFLMDPGMEPVVQTSRIRLATASVQLFIQRCLLNLEPGVLPSAIHSDHWEWMKRYRVWEANRKISFFRKTGWNRNSAMTKHTFSVSWRVRCCRMMFPAIWSRMLF